GRTVFFVSHNLTAVQSLCTRAIMLRNGKVGKQGKTGDVVQHYLEATVAQTRIPLADRKDRTGNGTARIRSIVIENVDKSKTISTGSRVRFLIEYNCRGLLRNGRIVVGIYDILGVNI